MLFIGLLFSKWISGAKAQDSCADVVIPLGKTVEFSELGMGNKVHNMRFLLKGDLLIDADLHVSDCRFYCDKNVQIIVGKGVSVTSRGCEYTEAFNEMWNGIVLNAGANWNSTGDTYTQAINALQVNTGAKFKVRSSEFVSNHVGIFIDEQFLPQTLADMEVEGTKFYTGAPLLAPYSGQNGNIGVKIRRVREIQIGDDWSLRNEFYAIRTGIEITRSSVAVYAGHFHDLVQEATGIFATTTFVDFAPTIVVGNGVLTGQRRNEFDNVQKRRIC